MPPRAPRSRAVALVACLAIGAGLAGCGGDDTTSSTAPSSSTTAELDQGVFAQTLVDDGYADDIKSAQCATDQLLKKLSPDEVQAVLKHQADTLGPKGAAGLTELESQITSITLTCSLQK